MKNGFLIINYNDYDTTRKLIDNIKEYKIIDKIVVVDNVSTDDSYEKLKKLENEKIVIIQNVANKGYGSGINFGSKYLIDIYGECNIIISNADIVIYKEEDIKKLIETFDNETAIVAPIIKEHSGYNRGWKIPSPLTDFLLNIPYIHKYLKPKLIYYKDNYYKNEIINVEVVSGCFFIIKSKYLEEVNYFDENVFLYYEENIIAKKLKQINKITKINTKVEVFHNHSVTIDKNVNKIRKYKILKESQLYFQKEYNKANFFEIILLNLSIKITEFVQYILQKI